MLIENNPNSDDLRGAVYISGRGRNPLGEEENNALRDSLDEEWND